MRQTLALLAAIPTDERAASIMFDEVAEGSFAEEWRRGKPELCLPSELSDAYSATVVSRWRTASQALRESGHVVIPDVTKTQLRNALREFDVVALLAHHVQTDVNALGAIELADCMLDEELLASMSPERPSIVHLGVCRSVGFTQALKRRCSSTRVISSRLTVDPEFFLELVRGTVSSWLGNEDYAEAHARLRFALFDRLGVGP